MLTNKEDPRKWVAIDADLWQTPKSKLKLSWPARKLAIYLRAAAGVYDNGEEIHSGVVLRSINRLVVDTGLKRKYKRHYRNYLSGRQSMRHL